MLILQKFEIKFFIMLAGMALIAFSSVAVVWL